MKYYVTGVDADGKSCVVGDFTVEGQPDTAAVTTIFATAEAPPPPRPAGTGAGADRDLGLAPGQTQFLVVRWAPDQTAYVHHTDSVDYDVVLSGSIDLVLDRGDLHLDAGDGVVVAGVDHGWRSGPAGAVVAVTLIGSAPRGDVPTGSRGV